MPLTYSITVGIGAGFVTYVLVKRLYVVETLHTQTPIPGDETS